MAANPANELVSALQSVHIREKPSIEHDLAPETSVDTKIPVDILSPSSEDEGAQHSPRSLSSASSTIPSDIIRPRPRRRTLPPFPDFRFEQSYLASIKSATSNWQVAYITMRDQLLWPLVSGVAYNLVMFGWRHWNRDVKLQGRGLGARLRRWWWEVNSWSVPKTKKVKRDIAKSAEDDDMHHGSDPSRASTRSIKASEQERQLVSARGREHNSLKTSHHPGLTVRIYLGSKSLLTEKVFTRGRYAMVYSGRRYVEIFPDTSHQHVKLVEKVE